MFRRLGFGALVAGSIFLVVTPAWAPQVGSSVVEGGGFDGGVIPQALPCPSCLSGDEVSGLFENPAYYYGQLGSALDMPPAIAVGVKAAPNTIGLFNPFKRPIEIIVTTLASGSARTYSLGPSEIVTVECGDCRSELEISIETSGQPPFAARFDGGAIVVPAPSGGRWQLARLGAGE